MAGTKSEVNSVIFEETMQRFEDALKLFSTSFTLLSDLLLKIEDLRSTSLSSLSEEKQKILGMIMGADYIHGRFKIITKNLLHNTLLSSSDDDNSSPNLSELLLQLRSSDSQLSFVEQQAQDHALNLFGNLQENSPLNQLFTQLANILTESELDFYKHLADFFDVDLTPLQNLICSYLESIKCCLNIPDTCLSQGLRQKQAALWFNYLPFVVMQCNLQVAMQTTLHGFGPVFYRMSNDLESLLSDVEIHYQDMANVILQSALIYSSETFFENYFNIPEEFWGELLENFVAYLFENRDECPKDCQLLLEIAGQYHPQPDHELIWPELLACIQQLRPDAEAALDFKQRFFTLAPSEAISCEIETISCEIEAPQCS